MCRRAFAVCAAVGCLGISLPTLAAGDDARFEVTPYAGYRVGGTFDDTDSEESLELGESSAWGLIVNGRVQENTEWEVFYSRQSTEVQASGFIVPQTLFDIDVDFLHFGGTYLFDGERVRPFIALTIGATRFSPGLPGFGARTYASASFGGGWKVRVRENVGLRLEVRGFGTVIDSSSRLFCESDGGAACLILAKGEILAQWEARAGVSIRF